MKLPVFLAFLLHSMDEKKVHGQKTSQTQIKKKEPVRSISRVQVGMVTQEVFSNRLQKFSSVGDPGLFAGTWVDGGGPLVSPPIANAQEGCLRVGEVFPATATNVVRRLVSGGGYPQREVLFCFFWHKLLNKGLAPTLAPWTNHLWDDLWPSQYSWFCAGKHYYFLQRLKNPENAFQTCLNFLAKMPQNALKHPKKPENFGLAPTEEKVKLQNLGKKPGQLGEQKKKVFVHISAHIYVFSIIFCSEFLPEKLENCNLGGFEGWWPTGGGREGGSCLDPQGDNYR